MTGKTSDARERGAGEGADGRMRAAYKDGGAHRYDDMLHLPHHVSKNHPQMPLSERAAQFVPFAALSGHGDAIRETQRQMEERMEHEYD